MALPPTRIYQYISTPEKTLSKLMEAGLLRSDMDDAHFIQVMRDVEANFHMPPGMTGPNIMDHTAMALGQFLNEEGQALASTPLYYPGPGGPDQEKTGTVKAVATGLLGVTFALVLPVLLYLGVLTALGLRPHPDITWIHYVAGSALALFTTAVISLVGESLIEDVVKFAFFGGAALAIWGGKATPRAAIMLGIAVGAFMPLLYRLVGPWLERGAKGTTAK